MAVISAAQMKESVQPGLRKVFTAEFNEEADQSLVSLLYRMESSESMEEDYLEMEDIGNMPEFTGDLTYTEFKEGNKKTVKPLQYALGLKLQQSYFEDDLYGVIEEMVKEMAGVARYRMEESAASPFTNAFNTVFTTFDGLSLCNTAHTFVSTSTTQSNSGTTPFSYAALDATLSLVRRFKNSQDRFMLNPKFDMLFGPVELETVMTEVIQSQLKAGTNQNDINVFNRKFRIATTPFLSDVDNWFLIDSKKMKKWNIWIQRVALEFKNAGDFDTYVKKWAMRMRYANTPLHWPWIFGHNVS